MENQPYEFKVGTGEYQLTCPRCSNVETIKYEYDKTCPNCGRADLEKVTRYSYHWAGGDSDKSDEEVDVSYKCSNPGCEYVAEDTNLRIVSPQRWDIRQCPNCGAQMSGKMITYDSRGIKEIVVGKDSNKGNCYVATAVYGSYDCPEVWTLRRYRDYSLAETWSGRAFINTYYAISPTIVKWFGNTNWFRRFWKSKLDKKVAKLNDRGFERTPYLDKAWK